MGYKSTEASRRARDLKAEARKLGFDACGIAAADSTDPSDNLGAWLSEGHHADMLWMQRNRAVRQDVTRKLPGARSVVVVARNYFSARPPKPAKSGRVAAYAWGRDYHLALRKPLRQLADYLCSLEDSAAAYATIDSGPVMERTWAQRSGVGAIGKNSLALRQDMGSWFFLATILTTVELSPDEPAEDICGTCRLCLDACPTGAIVRPQVVDARKCISYHTIENRGAIPEELQPAFQDWVFGCDICQEVCPWNRFAHETSETDFLPRPDQANPDLDRLVACDEADFRERFQGTPLMRAKYEGMMRNAGVAKENSRRSQEVLTPTEERRNEEVEA